MNGRQKKPFASMKDVLASLNGPNGLPFDLKDAEIWQVWDEVMGPAASSNARPLHIINGVLVICVREPIWLQELRYQVEDIIHKLNARLGRQSVRAVRFRLEKG